MSSEPLSIIIAGADERSSALLREKMVGQRCRVATDGLDAFELHRREPADVVLVHRFAPSLGGIELCRLIRLEENNHYAYLIVLCDPRDATYEQEGLRAGADAVAGDGIERVELEARLLAARRVVALQRRLGNQADALRTSAHRNFTASRIDALTGIRNRRGLFEDVEALIASPVRPHVIAICDIDDFKIYNDHFGHQAGDRALEWVSEAMRGAIRRSDGLYRYGGEEFLILLPDQSMAGAMSVMERLRVSIEALHFPVSPGGDQRRLTVSIGVAELRAGDLAGAADWVGRADAALYRAKSSGRNRVEIAAANSG